MSPKICPQRVQKIGSPGPLKPPQKVLKPNQMLPERPSLKPKPEYSPIYGSKDHVMRKTLPKKVVFYPSFSTKKNGRRIWKNIINY